MEHVLFVLFLDKEDLHVILNIFNRSIPFRPLGGYMKFY